MTSPSSASGKRPIRLAYLCSHPIQYYSPLLREVAKQPDIALKALFMSDFSTREFKDEGFGTTVQWDIPLLEGYEHEMLPYRGKSQPVRGFNQWHTGIRSVLKAGQYDAIWSHGYAHPTNLRFLWTAKSLGIKTLVRADSQIASAIGSGYKRKVKDVVVRQVFSLIDGFLAIGSRNREYYLHYGVRPDRVFDMPFAVDNEFFQSKVAAAHPNREALRKELGLDASRPIILFAGKFIGRKRAGDVLQAYAKLSPDGKKEPHPYLLMVGDGELRGSLEATAAQFGWNSIRFLRSM